MPNQYTTIFENMQEKQKIPIHSAEGKEKRYFPYFSYRYNYIFYAFCGNIDKNGGQNEELAV